ncbi:ABC transporter substrate-binding protein [Microbacterium sp. Marseille-Q6965]|uniref:ABC transporter substrate-binding protein n=1 Tax=Microbacterium sp. Marseille-Q6965 TaxID=2965072 RepID=UPI0021B7D94F|nr:ABC transporter substrate-binding protein [Microbacterium sp. Marseille-Q6965]
MSLTPRRGIRAAAIASVLAGALALASCSASGPSPEPTEPDADATLRVGLVLEPDNLDIRRTSGAALEQALIDNVYEGLVSRTPQGEVVPRLATEYEVSPDGLTYTFTIADGVTFHDGGELTVEDVVASLEAVRADESYVDHAVLANVASVEAPDDTTVVITLNEPNQNFLFALAGRAGLVFDEGDETDLRTAANGTGPFTVAEWVDGDHVTLARNDAYWGDPAGVAEVVLQYIPEATALVNAGLDGSLDAITAVDPEFVPELEGSFEVSEGLTTDKFILAFNDAAPPLDDPRVREALRMAIDHQAIVETVGAGTPQFGPIPELDPGYEDLSDVVGYDPEAARELLAEAGAENIELELTIPNVYGTTVSTLLVGAFDEIGVQLSVEPVEFSTWLNDVYTNQDYELSYVNHVEPRDFDTWTDPDYYYAISDEEVLTQVQGLYADAMRETDPDASAQLLAEAARIVAEYHPADWLYTRADIVAVAPGVEGFPADATSTRLPLAGVTFAG